MYSIFIKQNLNRKIYEFLILNNFYNNWKLTFKKSIKLQKPEIHKIFVETINFYKNTVLYLL